MADEPKRRPSKSAAVQRAEWQQRMAPYDLIAKAIKDAGDTIAKAIRDRK